MVKRIRMVWLMFCQQIFASRKLRLRSPPQKEMSTGWHCGEQHGKTQQSVSSMTSEAEAPPLARRLGGPKSGVTARPFFQCSAAVGPVRNLAWFGKDGIRMDSICVRLAEESGSALCNS